MPERSIGAVMRDIGGNVDRLAHAELRLIVAELHARIEAIGELSALVAAAAVAATLTALFLLLGGMFALAHAMPLWLAALVIAVIPGAATAALFLHCRTHLAQVSPNEADEIPTAAPETP